MSKKSIAGPIYLCFIGLAVALMGALFMTLLWKSYQSAKETRGWPTVEGRITDAAVVERQLGPEIPAEYSLGISYEYEWEGKEYEGDHLKRRENPWYKERARIDIDLENWLPGSQLPVFVNPADPEEAVLAHETKAGGYSIWFPALFVGAGVGILLTALRKIFSGAEKGIAS
ncbi:DUF3592 domain-containing protein [Akkermansiaceae bacterium]|nr:DUF3592 domain-containing protein [Akkermansiaceae bacterium]